MVPLRKRCKLTKPRVLVCLLVAFVLPWCVQKVSFGARNDEFVTDVEDGPSDQSEEHQKILELEEQNEREEKAEENGEINDKGNEIEEERQKLEAEERKEGNENEEKAEENSEINDEGNEIEEDQQKPDVEEREERNKNEEKAEEIGDINDKGNEIEEDQQKLEAEEREEGNENEEKAEENSEINDKGNEIKEEQQKPDVEEREERNENEEKAEENGDINDKGNEIEEERQKLEEEEREEGNENEEKAEENSEINDKGNEIEEEQQKPDVEEREERDENEEKAEENGDFNDKGNEIKEEQQKSDVEEREERNEKEEKAEENGEINDTINEIEEDQQKPDTEEREERNEKEEKAEGNEESQDKGNKTKEGQQKLNVVERGEQNKKEEEAEENNKSEVKGNKTEQQKQKSGLEKQQERNERRENDVGENKGTANEIKNAKIKGNGDIIDFLSIVGNRHWNEEPGTPGERFSRRRKFMEEKCRRVDVSRQSLKMIKSNKIGIFFKQKTVTCLANKSGSTTWRTHLQRVNHSPSIYQQKDKRWEAFMRQPNLPKVISEKTNRVITVRHPLIRLVSAYRQRYENGKIPKLYVWNRKSSHMRKYFSNYWLPAVISNNLIPADERKKMGIPDKHRFGKVYSTSLLMKVHQRLGGRFFFTFPMFLRHVVYTHRHNIVDNHWKPIDWLCSPCLLHYNFVVKLETMTEDLDYVFRKLNIPSEPSIKKNKERSVESPWTDIGRYRDVPLELKKEILRLYWNDLLLFDYKLPPGFLG